MMTAQEHETDGGASRLAATAVDENSHDAIGRAPFLEIVEGALNQLRRRDSRSGFDVVASEDDLAIGPCGADCAGESRCSALGSVGWAFKRDHDCERDVVFVAGFDEVHDFGGFADG
jgi:hypothetical protein